MKIPADIAKKFLEWIKVKIFTEISGRHLIFSEGEIWWTSIGHNIGMESNGKNENFERPVLILRKFGKDSFWGISVSSNIRIDHFYYRFKLKGEEYCLNLSQLRLLSSKRLLRRVGYFNAEDFTKVRSLIKDLV
ncbi:MAG: type II toxin-antitoxin system PemK/MazF family toxin [Candidatus Paceibacterota bacterium]